jgi:hypothetical protein
MKTRQLESVASIGIRPWREIVRLEQETEVISEEYGPDSLVWLSERDYICVLPLQARSWLKSCRQVRTEGQSFTFTLMGKR